MKNNTKAVVFALTIGLLLPTVVISIVANKDRQESFEDQTTLIVAVEATQAATSVNADNLIPILMDNNSYVYMELDQYVVGVVLAEMPADFEVEALKAQAVAARTYALKRHSSDGKHELNALCTEPSCCQAYCSEADYLAKGEKKDSFDKVVDAVKQTQGQVLTYNNALIDATYFSCSGGRTEDAQAVWGSDVPYLQAVDSPGEEQAEYYSDTLYYNIEEFAECMQLPLEDLTGNWLGSITYTDGAGIETIEICNRVYTGVEVRHLLGLRSTSFVISPSGNTVTVTTKGFGHRVGMSQYGAEAMAVNGSTYEQILAYYYQGVTLDK